MKKLFIISIFAAVVSSIFIHFYAFNKTAIYIDPIYHLYDMKQYYETKTIPVVGNRLTNPLDVRDNTTYARIPGGFYYILYLLCYTLGGASITGARIIYIILCALILIIFLFWVYKKFSLYLCAVLSALILTNGYVMFSSNDFWNPNIPLMLSFILFIMFSEYVSNNDDKLAFTSAMMIFPIEALMAQGHIAVFFSVVPTTIIYLIIRYKRTLKYIKAHLLGVFIAFLTYLPYLVSEIKNGFFNMNLMLNMQSSSVFKGLPQVYSILIFPTNEISVLYGTNSTPVNYFWFSENTFIIGMIFLAITAVISLAAFIYSIIFLIKSRKSESKIPTYIIEREGFIFYLLFIPATCFTFFIFKSVPGTFRYLYGIFAFSFITIIILFNELLKNKNKLLMISIILITLNSINMGFLHLTRYYNLFEAPYTENKFRNILTAISKDAEGRAFKIIPYDENYFDNMKLAYFPNLDWNRDDNSKLVYFIYYEVENIRLKTTGKSKPYDDILNNLPTDAEMISGDDKLKVYRYVEN
ncbi:hypothetical protein BFL38_08070 [Brachyspira hampsonii]|uniref:Glycosyltransferase RgtA/B/C/D-like domain-containing protein n=1 Tax=Brachyspira hampsonii TaxID=1287055 RepID=A0A1E5NF59_9SPIR|nr:hypothetical protein [Brachyspira hampsonii]OEJ14784.1 hypothetical protein BFL38_08070 [Brachyspira hampsonii]